MEWLAIITALAPLIEQCRQNRGDAAVRQSLATADARAQRAVISHIRESTIDEHGRKYWRKHRDRLKADALTQLQGLTGLEIDGILADSAAAAAGDD